MKRRNAVCLLSGFALGATSVVRAESQSAGHAVSQREFTAATDIRQLLLVFHQCCQRELRLEAPRHSSRASQLQSLQNVTAALLQRPELHHSEAQRIREQAAIWQVCIDSAERLTQTASHSLLAEQTNLAAMQLLG